MAGDTLSSLARHIDGNLPAWPRLSGAHRDRPAAPDVIVAGQTPGIPIGSASLLVTG